jgi:hypothetical protein
MAISMGIYVMGEPWPKVPKVGAEIGRRSMEAGANLFNPKKPIPVSDIRAMAQALAEVEEKYRVKCVQEFGEAMAMGSVYEPDWEWMSWGMRYWVLGGRKK